VVIQLQKVVQGDKNSNKIAFRVTVFSLISSLVLSAQTLLSPQEQILLLTTYSSEVFSNLNLFPAPLPARLRRF
jgi:hypothetical protein